MRARMSGDRVFACIAILLVGIYGYFAFFDISAPIQYDPLGPEGWPRFLAIMALLLSSYLLWRPVVENFAAAGGTAKRILLSATMLAGYAFTFEWLGFALGTTIFCAALARLLGAGRLGAIVFGIVAGVGLYVVAVHLLGLNLPVGEIYPHGTGAS